MYLFNTQTGKIEPFTAPRGTVGIYVCGVTPYDTTHVGHAFTFLTFDILIRYLRYLDFPVTYVQNVTDIDDDILRKAKELGVKWDELARVETEKYRRDMRDLNALDPDHYVRATDHIPDMIAIIEKLLANGCAYEVNGSVYFSVDRFEEFGKLSHLPREQMLPIASEATTRMIRTSATHSISCSGRRRSQVSRRGIRRGVRAGPAGTLSAVPWLPGTSGRSLISMVVARILSFLTTSVKSPRVSARRAKSRLRAFGCMLAWSGIRVKR